MQPSICPAPTGLTYRMVPVAYHGPAADAEYVAPGRYVVEIPGRTWSAARPEECAYVGPGEWVADGELLVCPECGLNDT